MHLRGQIVPRRRSVPCGRGTCSALSGSPFSARGYDLVRSDQNPAGPAHTIAVAHLALGIDRRIDTEDLQPITRCFGGAACRDRVMRIFEQQEGVAQLRETRP